MVDWRNLATTYFTEPVLRASFIHLRLNIVPNSRQEGLCRALHKDFFKGPTSWEKNQK